MCQDLETQYSYGVLTWEEYVQRKKESNMNRLRKQDILDYLAG